MKKTVLLAALTVSSLLTRAQRFFYVESNAVTENLLKERLIKASQFICPSPVVSDYIIQSTVTSKEGNTVTLQMDIQDSLTRQTIYQTKEEYCFGIIHIDQRLVLDMAIKTFIEKNIDQILLCSKADHTDSHLRFLKARKDKT